MRKRSKRILNVQYYQYSVMVASVHAPRQRNGMYVQTVRWSIYETRRPEHPHSPIRRYERLPQGPPSRTHYTPYDSPHHSIFMIFYQIHNHISVTIIIGQNKEKLYSQLANIDLKHIHFQCIHSENQWILGVVANISGCEYTPSRFFLLCEKYIIKNYLQLRWFKQEQTKVFALSIREHYMVIECRIVMRNKSSE